MWADNETSEDLLGFKVHADLILDVVNDERILPVTIGVFGDWGSGKSSILKIIYSQLGGTSDRLIDDTLLLYFNGWVFEGYDDAKAALLESILEQFEKHKTIGGRVKEQTQKLLKSVKWMRAVSLGFKKVVVPLGAAYLTGGTSLIPFLAQEFSKINFDDLREHLSGENAEKFLKEIIQRQPDDDSTLVREFRDDFKQMIEKSRIKKLIVIIDDLDRCTPERIIENLEAIKLFLNVERTAFIIGADPRIVRHAIEFKYKTDSIERSQDPHSRNERIVSDYLEKLIQVPYILPKLSDNEVETYMTLLYCQKELGSSFKKILDAFYLHRDKNRYGVFGFGDIKAFLNENEESKLNDSVSLIASLSSIITQGLNGNPRQIKRFLNTFTLRERLVRVAKLHGFRLDILAKLMVLEYSKPEHFRKIYNWQVTQNGEPKELKELEVLSVSTDDSEMKSRYPEWIDESIRKWLHIDPKLSDIDLRDYYWISRDQLGGSISGTSLISPHVRIVLKKLIDHGSGTILTSLTKVELPKLNNSDLDSLLALLEKELLKTPENDRLHKVFIEMMAQKINNSVQSYSRIIKQVDNAKVPFSLRNQIYDALKQNPSIQEILHSFKKDSPIGRALKQG